MRTPARLTKLRRGEGFVSFDPETWVPYLLSLPSGYGTDPYRPVWMAIVLIALFSGLFAVIGFRDKEKRDTEMKRRFWASYALAYSVQTFIPFLTIPGIKDANWELRHSRWLVPISGLLGAILFGTAAYSAAISL